MGGVSEGWSGRVGSQKTASVSPGGMCVWTVESGGEGRERSESIYCVVCNKVK